jgi:hypothetical protein
MLNQKLKRAIAWIPIKQADASTPFAKSFFIASLAIFIVARIALVAIPISERVEPIEVDDSYSYIAKSIIMDECYKMDCPALVSLRQQITGQSDNYRQALVRNRIDLNVFTFYHPLYSAGFNTVSAFGYDPPQTYNILYIAFGIITTLGLGLWMRAVWGNLAAGIALLLLSFYVFTGPGLHVFVPSNIALGIASYSWAIILQEQRRKYWAIPFIWIAAIGIHTIGIVYSGAAMLLLLLKGGWPIVKKSFWLLISGATILIIRFGISLYLPQYRLFRSDSEFFTSIPTYSAALNANFIDALDFTSLWANSYWNVPILIALLILGFITASSNLRKNILINGIVLLFLFLGSLAYANLALGSPAGRIWIPMAFFLTGAVGSLISSWFFSASHWIIEIQNKSESKTLMTKLRNKDMLRKGILLITLGLLIAMNLHDYSRFGMRHYRLTLENSSSRQDFSLGNEELIDAFRNINNNDSILYMKETALYYGLSYGMVNNEAIFYPSISRTQRETEFVYENENLHYVLTLNPIVKFPSYSRNGIEMSVDASLNFLFPSSSRSNSPRILIENNFSGAELLIALSSNSIMESSSIFILQEGIEWIEIANVSENTDEISLRPSGAEDKIKVNGFQFDNSTTFWPWGIGASIEYHDLSNSTLSPTSVSLNDESIMSDLNFNFEVLEDGSSLVFARIE